VKLKFHDEETDFQGVNEEEDLGEEIELNEI
jgi:hypothetical protein